MFLVLLFVFHHKDWLTYSSGTDRPGELCYNFYISNDLTQMVNFPTWIPDHDSPSPALWELFLSSDASICSTIGCPSIVKFWSCCFLSFHWLSIIFTTGCSVSLHSLTILVLIGMVSVIIWEMFHGRVSLRSVLLLLLVNFVSWFRLELVYISLIENIKSGLTHPHGFQLLVLPP